MIFLPTTTSIALSLLWCCWCCYYSVAASSAQVSLGGRNLYDVLIEEMDARASEQAVPPVAAPAVIAATTATTATTTATTPTPRHVQFSMEQRTSAREDEKDPFSETTGVFPSSTVRRTRQRIVAYYTAWGNMATSAIPATNISHLNYAFAQVVNGTMAVSDPWTDVEKPFPGDNDTQAFKGNYWQINHVLKGAHPTLRTLISVGGYLGSRTFSDIALTNESRRRFASSAATFVERYLWDGLDIDWEYPVGGESTHDTRSSLSHLARWRRK